MRCRHVSHGRAAFLLHTLPVFATLIAGCADAPAEHSPCAVDLPTRTLRCVASDDPIPGAVDDESTFQLLITFAPDAFDGATRVIDGTADHVTTQLSYAGLMYDASRVVGLEPGPTHDAAVDDVLMWRRVHLLEVEGYDRVEVSGEVAVDAAGHGHIAFSWTDPASSRAAAGSVTAEF